MWFDIDGNAIPREQAEALLADIAARRVAVTTIGPWEVSTVHLVLDHSFGYGYGPPLIFETMVFPECEVCVRTPTKDAALATHDQVVAQVRDQLRDRKRG